MGEDSNLPDDAEVLRHRAEFGLEDMGQFLEGDFVALTRVLLAEDTDYFLDQSRMRRVADTASLPIGVLGMVISMDGHEDLEAGQRIAQPMNQVGGHGAQGGRFCGKGQFMIGPQQPLGSFLEQLVGALESPVGPNQHSAQQGAAANKHPPSLRPELEIQRGRLGGQLPAVHEELRASQQLPSGRANG